MARAQGYRFRLAQQRLRSCGLPPASAWPTSFDCSESVPEFLPKSALTLEMVFTPSSSLPSKSCSAAMMARPGAVTVPEIWYFSSKSPALAAATMAAECTASRGLRSCLRPSPTVAPAAARLLIHAGMWPTPSRTQSASLKWQQFWRSMSYSWDFQWPRNSSSKSFTWLSVRLVLPMWMFSRYPWASHSPGRHQKMPVRPVFSGSGM
mmetsp:Transcript_10632/g.32241  ORF Transcript_10632/g.32241 Transcript_10632/m.32241 type:complete len:207 (+) Transcript_10632:98-718(+)